MVADYGFLSGEELSSLLVAAQMSSAALVDVTKDVALASVRENGFCVSYLSDALNGGALCMLSEEMQADKAVVVAAFSSTYGFGYPRLLEKFSGDKEIALAAVRCRGLLLEFVSEALRADRDVVLAAVESNGYGIQF